MSRNSEGLRAGATRNLDSIPGKGMKCYSSPQRPYRILGPTQSPVQWVPELSTGRKLTGTWNWPFTSVSCLSYDYMDVNLRFLIRPNGLLQNEEQGKLCHFIISYVYSRNKANCLSSDCCDHSPFSKRNNYLLNGSLRARWNLALWQSLGVSPI
jgi:hypothetical protein